MRIGVVKLDLSVGYVVDLDNQDMVNEAKDWVYADIEAVMESDIYSYIKAVPSKTHTKRDIHSGLLEMFDEDEAFELNRRIPCAHDPECES